MRRHINRLLIKLGFRRCPWCSGRLTHSATTGGNNRLYTCLNPIDKNRYCEFGAPESHLRIGKYRAFYRQKRSHGFIPYTALTKKELFKYMWGSNPVRSTEMYIDEGMPHEDALDAMAYGLRQRFKYDKS